MPRLLNVLYLFVAVLLAPWLCWQAWVRKRPISGLRDKWLGQVDHPLLVAGAPTVWFHGVSVGEIHLLRQVVARFRIRFPGWQCVISTTTRTGYSEACRHFQDLPVVYWPFDFTWGVQRALAIVRPRLVVLAEGEIWPNFVGAAKKQGIALAVINARMSPKSARRFARVPGLLAGVFAKLDLIGAQNEEYRCHYERLGASNVVTTGNIKYDGVQLERNNPRTESLRLLLGLASDALMWVAGSTQDPEESVAIDIYRRAKLKYPRLRLVLVPRHPERFETVAETLRRSGLPFARRSTLPSSAPLDPDGVLLVDTVGELSAVWGLADLAFVGGSLDGKRGGQNMIEPSAYGCAVVFGPHTWNFKQTVGDLLAHQAALQVQDARELEEAVLRLCEQPMLRDRLGRMARTFVLSQQGATERTLDELEKWMGLANRDKIAA